MKRGGAFGRRCLGAVAAAFALAADQASKYWLLHVYRIGDRQPVRLAPVFDLVLDWNRGVSYSLFASRSAAGRWILVGVTLAITAALIFWLARAKTALTSLALGLIVGGALGNAADRLFRGAVADFFYFHVGAFHWYVFNLADCAIVAGVALLLLDSVRPQRESPTGDKRRSTIRPK